MNLSVKVSLNKLEEYCPIDSYIWAVKPAISFQEIKDRLDNKQYITESFDDTTKELNQNREQHIRRIAYLVVHGWDDPIDIDVGIPAWGRCPLWIIMDGNHRYMASCFLGHNWIQAECMGDVDVIETLLFDAP